MLFRSAGLALIKPGATIGALSDFVNGFGSKRGMKTAMQMHGCGYGDDGPLVSRRFAGARTRDLEIASGNAFVWKPIAMTADERIVFTWGGPVLVAAQGAEALSERAPGLVSIV